MAKKKEATAKVPKEKKVLTPADFGPFDVMKAMFTNHQTFEEIPVKVLEKFYYIINDRLSMLYPMQAAVFNHYKINGGQVVKCWEWFLQKQGFRSVPSCIYTKGKKKTEEENVSNNVLTKERIKAFARGKHYDVVDVEFALKIFAPQMTAEILQWEEDMKEIERIKKLSLSAMKSDSESVEEEELTLTLDTKNTVAIF